MISREELFLQPLGRNTDLQKHMVFIHSFHDKALPSMAVFTPLLVNNEVKISDPGYFLNGCHHEVK